jgi:FkbM family methyltransferase
MGLGYTDITDFYSITEKYKHIIPIFNGWTAKDDKENNIQIQQVSQRFFDDGSFFYYKAFVKWRLHREEWDKEWRNGFDNSNRYFTPEVVSVLHDHEVFLDGGAHHGQTINRFIEVVKGKYGAICAVEPVFRNIIELNSKEILRLSNYFCSLGKETGMMKFQDDLGYASKIYDKGSTSTYVRTVDDFGIPFTFIKLHLEGGEYNALLGARETISKHRPILAVTCYHSEDGLWKIPKLMMEMCKDYKFYFRLHTFLGQGAIAYAIPEGERK